MPSSCPWATAPRTGRRRSSLPGVSCSEPWPATSGAPASASRLPLRAGRGESTSSRLPRSQARREGGGWDSNPRLPGPQPGALPTELPPPGPSTISHPRHGQAATTGSPCYRADSGRCYPRGRRAPVAQWTEQRPSKPLVGGSNPPRRTRSRLLISTIPRRSTRFPNVGWASPGLNRNAASRTRCSRRYVQTVRVVAALAWPATAWTCATSAPASMSRDTQVWRMSCRRWPESELSAAM